MMRFPAIVMLAWLAVAGQLSLPSPTAPVNVRVVASVPVGPTASIICPAAAVPVASGANLQAAIDAQPEGATLCLSDASYRPTAPVHPKRNQVLVGQFGAEVDGRDVTQAWDQGGIAIISGWNCTNCAGVTLRNIYVRNSPGHHCVGSFGPNSGAWVLDHVEVSGCDWGTSFGMLDTGDNPGTGIGLVIGPTITNSRILNNVIGNYGFQRTAGTILADSVVTHGGGQQKFVQSAGSTVRNVLFDHNATQGLWFDGDNLGFVAEGVRAEFNGGSGIMVEVSGPGVIRNSVTRNSGESGVFLSSAVGVEVSGVTSESDWRGLNLFTHCAQLQETYPGIMQRDLRDNYLHDNVVKVGALAGSFAAGLSTSGFAQPSCPQSDAAYFDGSKNNRFQRNTYTVPTSGSFWFWNGQKTWAQWQSLGQDAGGTVQ